MIKIAWTGIVTALVLVAYSSASTNENSLVAPIENSTPAPTALSNQTYSDLNMAGMLEAHNEARIKKRQKPLIWSEPLAQHAKEWANYLAYQNGCVMKHRPFEGEYHRGTFGENISWASPSTLGNRVEIQKRTASDIVFAWADEEKDYDYASNTCKLGEQCGHYTQVIWHDTEQVGCARTVCPDKGQMWVCNYHPPGNYIGEKPY